MDKEKQAFEEKIADYLFTDGFGEKANRLVMEHHTGIKGAGWSRDVVIDVIKDFTNAEITRLKEDRDLWKESERKANDYSKGLLAEISHLKDQAEEQQHVIDNLGFDIDHLKDEIHECKLENSSLIVALGNAEAEIERMDAALNDIALQQKSTEWEEEGDTEGGYDAIIDIARQALTKTEEVEG